MHGFGAWGCAGGLFVLPSHGESSGSLALLEAMQAGLAIVASGVDGVPEDVTHGESALLVAPGRVDELTRALVSLLSDPARRRRLARHAREAFLARFSASVFSVALAAVYAELGLAPGRR